MFKKKIPKLEGISNDQILLSYLYKLWIIIIIVNDSTVTYSRIAYSSTIFPSHEHQTLCIIEILLNTPLKLEYEESGEHDESNYN